jgi:hypothetical protein
MSRRRKRRAVVFAQQRFWNLKPGVWYHVSIWGYPQRVRVTPLGHAEHLSAKAMHTEYRRRRR